MAYVLYTISSQIIYYLLYRNIILKKYAQTKSEWRNIMIFYFHIKKPKVMNIKTA